MCVSVCGCPQPIDYIFFTPRVLKPVMVMETYPWSKSIHPSPPRLPNGVIPSDHLPLLAAFVFEAPSDAAPEATPLIMDPSSY